MTTDKVIALIVLWNGVVVLIWLVIWFTRE